MGRTADTSEYTCEEIDLWEKIIERQNEIFRTKKGLEFKIEIKGNELFVDRRQKPITRASVNIAFKKWNENKDCGPKALGVFGSSYLWSLFREVDKEITTPMEDKCLVRRKPRSLR